MRGFIHLSFISIAVALKPIHDNKRDSLQTCHGITIACVNYGQYTSYGRCINNDQVYQSLSVCQLWSVH